MRLLPFLNPNLARPIAWQDGGPVTAEAFCAAVAHLAERLPDRPYVINLCDGRYRFLIGLAAAMSRGQITLLPQSRAPQALLQLGAKYTGTYCLSDGAEVPSALTRVDFAFPERARDSVDLPAFAADQIAVIPFTSGSTGEPSPHPKSWGSLVTNAAIARQRLVSPAFDAGGVLVGTVPHQHMYGLESTLMMPLHAGITIHAGRPFFPADLRETLAAIPAPRLLIITPVHLRAYVNDAAAMPAVEMIVSATAPLPLSLAQAAEQLFGAPVYEIYGCTEAGAIATRRTSETSVWQCYDGVALSEDGERCAASGGHLAQAVPLSDVIELHTPERFELRGRSSDLINIAGKRASLADLNLQLMQIEGVVDGVFFMPDETDGEVTRLMAFVVAPDLTAGAILEALRRRVDAAFLPRPLVHLERLPRAETGKLPRARLVELAAQHAKSAGAQGR